MSGAVLHPECATSLAERHARIAERDIPSTPEVEILTRSHCVLGLLAHIQDDEPAVRGLDERGFALVDDSHMPLDDRFGCLISRQGGETVTHAPELELDCLTSTASRQPTLQRAPHLGFVATQPMQNCP
jgi:hypothetical protein